SCRVHQSVYDKINSMLTGSFQYKKKLSLLISLFYLLVVFELFGIYALHVYSSGRPWNMLRNELIFDLGGALVALVGMVLIINYKRIHTTDNHKNLPKFIRFFNTAAVIMASVFIACFTLAIILYVFVIYVFHNQAPN
ncbi:MAG TPA: hypothetical protein VNZ45_03545, partial [Bacteroidia bacterium]|nr:hypothetical protein [Bacteroidia bacterium]